eukprot:COSAG01_NODE_24179_length_787_cov_2.244186_1_plen_114_part_00
MPSSSEHAKTLGPVAAAAANSTATASGGGGGAGRCRSQKRSRSSSERSIQPQPPAKRSALEDDALLLSPKQYNGGKPRKGTGQLRGPYKPPKLVRTIAAFYVGGELARTAGMR